MTLVVPARKQHMSVPDFTTAAIGVGESVNGVCLACEDEQTITRRSPASVHYATPKTHVYFANDVSDWVPLPAWGNFFIDIGSRVAFSKTGQNRLVVGLAVPTRTCAAALAALGVVRARAVNPNKIIFKDKFEQLGRLRRGTRVFYRNSPDSNEWLSANYDGICNDYEQPRIRIRVKPKEVRKKNQDPDTIYLIRKEDLYKVRLAAGGAERIDTQGKFARPIVIKEFLDGCIGGANALDFSTTTQLDCVIIGRISTLREEITKIPFAYRSAPSSLKEGVLQDVLRVRKFFTSEDQAYRLEILPVDGHEPPKTADGLVPHVTIFDGATGFIKWRDYYRNSHWIILLDRTEPRFQEAVYILNQEYIPPVDGEKIQGMPSIPLGVELVAYQESHQ